MVKLLLYPLAGFLLISPARGYRAVLRPTRKAPGLFNHWACGRQRFCSRCLDHAGAVVPQLPPAFRTNAANCHGVMCTSVSVDAGRAVARWGSLATVALLRGGGAEHNVLAGVLAELANARTPAALLGGAALGTMFVGLKPGFNKRLHLLYTALATSAFSLQLVCVLCSTLTYTAVASQSEAIAVSAISYLSQQMQFEFYVIRSSFVYGLFCFLGALMVRGWITYSEQVEQGSARVNMIILAASSFFLLNFLHHTHNSLTLCLGGMTKRVLWLTLANMYASKRRLLRHVGWVVSAWTAVKVLKLGPNQGADDTAPAEKIAGEDMTERGV